MRAVSLSFSMARYVRTEHVPPFALAGDTDGNYYNWRPRPGTTPFSLIRTMATLARSRSMW